MAVLLALHRGALRSRCSAVQIAPSIRKRGDRDHQGSGSWGGGGRGRLRSSAYDPCGGRSSKWPVRHVYRNSSRSRCQFDRGVLGSFLPNRAWGLIIAAEVRFRIGRGSSKPVRNPIDPADAPGPLDERVRKTRAGVSDPKADCDAAIRPRSGRPATGQRGRDRHPDAEAQRPVAAAISAHELRGRRPRDEVLSAAGQAQHRREPGTRRRRRREQLARSSPCRRGPRPARWRWPARRRPPCTAPDRASARCRRPAVPAGADRAPATRSLSPIPRAAPRARRELRQLLVVRAKPLDPQWYLRVRASRSLRLAARLDSLMAHGGFWRCAVPNRQRRLRASPQDVRHRHLRIVGGVATTARTEGTPCGQPRGPEIYDRGGRPSPVTSCAWIAWTGQSSV